MKHNVSKMADIDTIIQRIIYRRLQFLLSSTMLGTKIKRINTGRQYSTVVKRADLESHGALNL